MRGSFPGPLGAGAARTFGAGEPGFAVSAVCAAIDAGWVACHVTEALISGDGS